MGMIIFHVFLLFFFNSLKNQICVQWTSDKNKTLQNKTTWIDVRQAVISLPCCFFFCLIQILLFVSPSISHPLLQPSFLYQSFFWGRQFLSSFCLFLSLFLFAHLKNFLKHPNILFWLCPVLLIHSLWTTVQEHGGLSLLWCMDYIILNNIPLSARSRQWNLDCRIWGGCF